MFFDTVETQKETAGLTPAALSQIRELSIIQSR
jgi:hypothetical protein